MLKYCKKKVGKRTIIWCKKVIWDVYIDDIVISKFLASNGPDTSKSYATAGFQSILQPEGNRK